MTTASDDYLINDALLAARRVCDQASASPEWYMYTAEHKAHLVERAGAYNDLLVRRRSMHIGT
jgi:hypothetical protein